MVKSETRILFYSELFNISLLMFTLRPVVQIIDCLDSNKQHGGVLSKRHLLLASVLILILRSSYLHLMSPKCDETHMLYSTINYQTNTVIIWHYRSNLLRVYVCQKGLISPSSQIQ